MDAARTCSVAAKATPRFPFPHMGDLIGLGGLFNAGTTLQEACRRIIPFAERLASSLAGLLLLHCGVYQP
jgi:hypothetical protein